MKRASTTKTSLAATDMNRRFMTMTMLLRQRRSDSLRVRSGLTCSRGSARGQGSRLLLQRPGWLTRCASISWPGNLKGTRMPTTPLLSTHPGATSSPRRTWRSGSLRVTLSLTMAPHKLFDEIYSLIDAHEFDGERPNASAVLTFGHSGGIKPIINAFEIFRDDRNLTAEDFGTDYKWKISNLGTFASNIGLIMYSCSGDYDGTETKVMLVHNEHVVEEQPACGETLCSVEDFNAYYQHIVDFDWDTECPMPEPENATNTTGAGESNNEVINIINIINIVSGDGSTEAGDTNSEDNKHHHNHEDNAGEEDSDEEDSDEDDSDEEDSDEDESDEYDSSEEEKDRDNKKCHKK